MLDERGIERAVLAGASMGAHTLLRFALDAPERVAGLVVITPGLRPRATPGRPRALGRAGARAAQGGVEGFVAAYGEPDVPASVAGHRRDRPAPAPGAATSTPTRSRTRCGQVPRSRPFAAWSDLRALDAPRRWSSADRDEADPGHPLAVGERYAAAIPGAELAVEEAGRSPLAWQGGQLSKIIAAVAARA